MNFKTISTDIIRIEMKKRKISVASMRERLKEIGENFKNDSTFTNRLQRGTFSAKLFIKCLFVMGIKEINLDNYSDID